MEADKIKELSKIFFEKMLISIDNIEVQIEEENIINIKIQTPDSSLVIWYSWKNLEDIRLVLRQILKKALWNFVTIHIEVNDYIEQKENKLIDFVTKKIEIVKTSWKEIILPFFNSYERKKIHNYISSLNDPQIWTKSIWEWKDRKLHIFKKIDANSIDLDWIDI